MKKAYKMNFLYKIAFVLMCVCVALFAAAIILMVVFENSTACVLTAVAGVFLCLAAIILAMFSKPKTENMKNTDEKNIDNRLDG